MIEEERGERDNTKVFHSINSMPVSLFFLHKRYILFIETSFPLTEAIWQNIN